MHATELFTIYNNVLNHEGLQRIYQENPIWVETYFFCKIPTATYREWKVTENQENYDVGGKSNLVAGREKCHIL